MDAVTVPAFLGRAAHAWFLDQIRQIDPAMAEALHQADAHKPFAVAPLMGESVRAERGRLRLRPDQRCYLRFTSLCAPLSTLLTEALPRQCLGQTLSLAGAPFRVVEVARCADEHPYADTVTYEGLRSRVQTRDRKGTLTLRFLSPTVFRRSPPRDTPFDDSPYMLPLPALVFGGLMTLWNAFAPMPLPEALTTYIRDCVVISAHQLRTTLVSFGGGRRGRVGGFLGQCRYALRCAEPGWRDYVTLLAAFAPFAGVGWRTSMGLGQVAWES